MNWMGLVAGLGGFGLGLAVSAAGCEWWTRRAVRRARVAECRLMQTVLDRWKNRKVLNGFPRRELEELAWSAGNRAELIEKGRA